MKKAVDLIERRTGGGSEKPSSGFDLETGGMITGAGWLSAGPGYRRFFANRVMLDTSAAVSWRAYKMAQATVEVRDVVWGGLSVGSQAIYQDMVQIAYFGSGTQTRVDDRSEYRLRTSDVYGFATYRPKPWLALEGRLGLVGSNMSEPAGPFSGKHPDARLHFAADPGMTLGDPPRFMYGGIELIADTRDSSGYPTAGGVYRAAWSHFNDRQDGSFNFDRLEIEGSRFMKMFNDRSVLAIHAWGVLTPSSQSVPFYLMPSMGGDSTLRAYENYRFHERNMVVLNAESRWALSKHVDGAVFVEAGDVAARAGDLGLGRKTFGVGVRLHTDTSTLLRLDFAHGGDGWRFLLRTSDPFRLKRLTRRHAAMPFVP
jgi:hypothetical protein